MNPLDKSQITIENTKISRDLLAIHAGHLIPWTKRIFSADPLDNGLSSAGVYK